MIAGGNRGVQPCFAAGRPVADQEQAQAYDQQQAYQQQPVYAAPAPAAPTADMDSKLAQLKELQLREQGVLTDAEFEAQKSAILAQTAQVGIGDRRQPAVADDGRRVNAPTRRGSILYRSTGDV